MSRATGSVLFLGFAVAGSRLGAATAACPRRWLLTSAAGAQRDDVAARGGPEHHAGDAGAAIGTLLLWAGVAVALPVVAAGVPAGIGGCVAHPASRRAASA
ncbi:hypothetical protein [Streptomyces sp. AC550_RSS872]|uniref:hypothetical protein n=1 Tax=Streptomyces sp. AC550_RSS872 TaxID=2823689 RepID=UPI001C2709D6|nr:hypothetical protein [Streptomyces sp. AC550_RSS872]